MQQQQSLYLPPEVPTPELVVKEWDGGMIYGWRCDGDGIAVYGESKKLARENWANAHREEFLLLQ